MRLSTRNQLAATVQEVTEGNVMATVKVVLVDGQTVTAAITREAVSDLSLATGDQVTVLVKATEVMLGHVGELGEPVDEGQPGGAGGPVSMLGHDDLGRASLIGVLVVDVVSVDEHDDVGVLLE